MPGISIITNFDVNENVPIDSRIVASNSTVRTNIQYKYEGLKVYQLDNQQSYIWDGFNWRVEYNGIYGGSGSIPGNTEINFGSVATTVGSSSNDLIFRANTATNNVNLKNDFIRHTQIIGLGNEWQGIEFRQQFQYKDSNPNTRNGAYISYNPPATVPGALAFGTGESLSYQVTERMRISSDGKVGIATTDPKEFLQIGSVSGSQKPFVIHNGGSAVIGYNWYFDGIDKVFDLTVGSSKIAQNNGSVTIQTRLSGAPAIDFTSHVSANGKVGIGTGTMTPNELLQIGNYTPTQLPLVLHNSGDAAIGHNWFYTTSSQFNDPTQGSGRIKFSGSGEILFSTRNPNATGFNSTMTLVNSRVGVNTTNPSYALDVTGDIKSSNDIYSGRDVNAARNVIAADKVETTNGYFFKNSPNNKITSSSTQMYFHVGTNPNLIIWPDRNVSYQDLFIQDNFLRIYNTSGNLNSRLAKGIVFGGQNSMYGSVIYPYQGASTNVIGLSIYNTNGSGEIETIRTSDGGQRVQIGSSGDPLFSNSNVVDGSTTNANGTSNSLIDTKDGFHYISPARLSATDKNLLKSGSWGYNDTTWGIKSYFTWIRVGKVIHVTLLILEEPISGGFPIYTNTSPITYNIIPSPIRWTSGVGIGGTCDMIYYDTPSLTLIGKLRVTESSTPNYLKFTNLYDLPEPSARRYRRIYGQYVMTLP
jgi:hypothetical protein